MVTNLVVEWVGPELRARWQGGEDPTVFVSASPDDAGTVIVPVSAPGGVRVLGLPEGFRAYVHVLDIDGEWAVAGERLIRLGPGAHAVDLGGHRTAAGESIGWGRLYAGDPVDELATAGLEAFDRLGVRTICDLRAADESAGRPGWLAPDIRWELPGVGEGEAGRLGEVATIVAERSNQPVYLHAGVGQDGAVVTSALLLAALGVADGELPFFPTRPEVLAEHRRRYGTIADEVTGVTGPGGVEALRRGLVAG